MQDFLQFFKSVVADYPMHLQIGYSKICDWTIHIYKKGCADDGGDLPIVNVGDCDMELCFAKAHVEFKNWLIKNLSGY